MKKNFGMVLIATAVVAFSFFTQPLYASNSVCTELLESSIEARTIESVIEQPTSLGFRGFLSARPKSTPENEKKGLAAGLMEWGLRIAFKDTLEEAQAHLSLDGNLLMNYVYVVSKTADFKALESEDRVEAFKKHILNGDFKIYEPSPDIDLTTYEEGSRFKADSDELKLAFRTVGVDQILNRPLTAVEQASVKKELLRIRNEKLAKEGKAPLTANTPLHLRELTPEQYTVFLENLPYVTPSKEAERSEIYGDGHLGDPEKYFYLKGLFRRVFQGVIEISDTKDSSTYKKLRKEMRTLYNRGYRFTVNQGFEQAIDMLPDQERSSLHLVTGQPVPTDPGSNRFRREIFDEVRSKFMELYREGKMGSVEVIDPNGKVVAATIYLREGNALSPDTVVYGAGGINFAKYTIADLIDLAEEAGVHIVDAGMVTPLTRGMKGKYVRRDYAEKRLGPLRRQAPTVLVGPTERIPN